MMYPRLEAFLQQGMRQQVNEHESVAQLAALFSH
jgi:flagellar biosynthesis/type III secretory pathway ATPase